ncbi:MAG TPA: HAMP domain-containing sensor histidine kinase [Flavitalea sp.]|nr:HAMP domain-containing sensor histidine kinase [Flavitalea sp.]
MKDLFNRLGGRRLFILAAALVLFLVAFVLNKYLIGAASSPFYADLIQKDIVAKERSFQRLAKDTPLLTSLINRSYGERTLNRVSAQRMGFFFFIYARDTSTVGQHKLLFWNTQQALPPMNIMNESNASRLVRLSNGLYVHTSLSIELPGGRQYALESLQPVLWRYFVENENLRKEFVSYPEAGKRVDISFKPTQYPVKSDYGNILFYIDKVTVHEQQTSWWTILIALAGVFLLFIYIHQVAEAVYRRYGLFAGIAFLSVIIIAIRSFTYIFPGFLELRQFELFDPAIYGSSYVFSSLGDLMINGLLFCWLTLFASRRITPGIYSPLRSGWLNMFCVVLALGLLVVFTFTFADILQSLVADAQISFNVTNFFSLTNYSFIGFFILGVLALSYFSLSRIVLNIVGRLSRGPDYFFIFITMAVGLTIISFTRNTAVVELNLYVLAWLVLYIWMTQRKILSGLRSRLNISEVVYWLFVFSFSIAAIIVFENRKIEFEQRKVFAEKLSLRADPSSERLLSIAHTYFDNDFLQRNFERFHDRYANADLKDSLIKKNFSAYIDKYDTRIYTFDASEKPLFNWIPASFDTLNTIFRIQGKETSIRDLRYFEKSFDKFSYIYRKEVEDSAGATMGYFFVISDPKRYKSDALTPELFRKTRELVPEYSPGYYYGVYSKLGLVSYYNDYPFPTRLSQKQLPKFEFEVRTNKSYEELWYRHSSDKVVVIAKKDNSFIEAITLFAYLFSTFIFLLAIYRFTALLARARFKKEALAQYLQLSIRAQIHTTILLVSLLSFLIIGVVTILFFVKRYDRNNQDRLSRAIQIMVNEVQNKLDDNNALDESLLFFDSGANREIERLMREISEIHGTDVNLYDTTGTLRVSSNPLIYNKGVLSEKMNPIAYYNLNALNAIQFVADEQMGKVDYISVYSPVRDDQGNAFAYLNIPSYSTQGELKQEIANFLVTIINLNAFIFLVAGAIALFITNRITHSFTLIGEKMREINLQRINQEIQWKRRDEIGELVKEYNKMVHKLDESAEALAKSEREGAWRQMARQVAHEIKNPLTPMKLSIQYLQKAIDNNSPNVKEMTRNVASTLIEQIDHLSKIAADFSQFANIGNPRNEMFDLHDLLHSLISLYKPTENVIFKWYPVPQRVMLFADKTQLNRLFTNLLQNAIEAPENKSMRFVELDETLEGDCIIVNIRDNGGGIPANMQEKIFAPNFTTKSSGTGLGLAMSKSIAEQARGDIWFETIEGEGTVFHVKLPLVRALD